MAVNLSPHAFLLILGSRAYHDLKLTAEEIEVAVDRSLALSSEFAKQGAGKSDNVLMAAKHFARRLLQTGGELPAATVAKRAIKKAEELVSALDAVAPAGVIEDGGDGSEDD
ncbi:MAG: hypothetical protein E6R03_16975 [Hyphomicrobiaceae bacterium]|nr:MAG: hypothetical protein E6R03_16975 [Hyphomicrobiaceae bacterium]